MKVIERYIFPYQEKRFFFPIRNKVDYAKLVVYSARKLLLNLDSGLPHGQANMKLIVDKMSRIFFYQDKKYFSVSFPFKVSTKGNEVTELESYSGQNVNSKSISAVIAILDSEQFKLNPSLVDFYIEPNGIESSGILLLEEIFQFEPSYIRYDHDKILENGKLHPLNHIDINYSQYSTYKLGLAQIITPNYFENLQNTKTDCSFIID